MRLNRDLIGVISAVIMVAIFVTLLLALFTHSAQAQTVIIKNEELGSGVPNAGFGLLNQPYQYNAVADKWDPQEGIFHAPQYMPGYPTAATIFPRVLDVECYKLDDWDNKTLMSDGDRVKCNGYHWMPEMGRGEYLFIRPHLVNTPTPVVVEKVVEKIVEKKVYVEVPEKHKPE